MTRDTYLCTAALIIQIKMARVFGYVLWISHTMCLMYSGGQDFRQAGCTYVGL
jgi:hypothetical protein